MYTFGKKYQFIVLTLVCLLALVSVFVYVKAQKDTPLDTVEHQHIYIQLTAKERAWLQKHPVIRVGVRHDWKPVEFFSESSQFRGISVDYLRHLELDLGVKFESYNIDDAPTSETVDMLSAVSHPAMLHGSGFDVLTPYIEAPYAIYTHKRNHQINSIQDLAGKRLAIYKHSPLVSEFGAKHPEISLIKVDLAEEAFDALAFDHADAYIGNELVVDYHAGIHALDYVHKVGHIEGSAKVSMAVRSDWPIFAGILNKSFKALAPHQERIIERWRVVNRSQNTYLTLTIAGLLLMGAALLVRAYRLNQRLKAQEKSAQDLVWRQANYDHLTELPNRMMFNRMLEQTITESAQNKTRFALLFVDIDHFKQINDRYGHLVGDELLKEVAQRIQRILAEKDLFARLAGDEFTVLAHHIHNENDVQNIAQTIVKCMERPFFIDKSAINITVSVGSAIYPNNTTQHNTLIKYADQAMYEAKKNGRNQFKAFNKSMKFADTARINIGQDLKNSIKNNQLIIHYQPIVELNSGKMVKTEALLRWNHPTMGLMTPNLFIHIAEETGMIEKIGQWVFNQALADLPNLIAIYGDEFQIGINVSPRQFGLAKHLQEWPKLLKTANVAGSHLCIEITESTFLNKEQSVIEILKTLREADIHLSIDDFGTGYSSLSYLKNFDVDFIKLDAHFVKDIATRKQDEILCESIIQMAHKLGIKVIAEWIETQEQRQLLTQLGCDYGQGYLFSKALPLGELADHTELATQA